MEISVRDDHQETLPPIELDAETQAAMPIPVSDDVQPEQPEVETQPLCSNDEVRGVIGLWFKGHYLATRAEHWIEDETEQDLDAITPALTRWVNEREWAKKVVHTVDTEGAPAQFLYVYGRHLIMDWRAHKSVRADNRPANVAVSGGVDDGQPTRDWTRNRPLR